MELCTTYSGEQALYGKTREELRAEWFAVLKTKFA